MHAFTKRTETKIMENSKFHRQKINNNQQEAKIHWDIFAIKSTALMSKITS
jgi:hypothetical protein